MSTPPPSPTTAAFHVQAVLSFAVSLVAVGVAVVNLPADPWVRAFLALGVLYVTTSAFTLAKTVRDRQETSTVVGRGRPGAGGETARRARPLRGALSGAQQVAQHVQPAPEQDPGVHPVRGSSSIGTPSVENGPPSTTVTSGPPWAAA
jgi:hypothetical protein